MPNPKPPLANHGYRNYSTHSTHSCHQEPGVSGPVCRPHHTGHVLKGSVKVTTPRLCNCGSPFLLSLIGSLVCSISHHARGFWSQFPPFLFPLQVISISPPSSPLVLSIYVSSTLISSHRLLFLARHSCECECASDGVLRESESTFWPKSTRPGVTLHPALVREP